MQSWSLDILCQLCPMKFSDQSALSAHYDTAHAHSSTRAPLPPRPEHPGAKYPCEVCGRKFKKSGDVHRHMRTVHGVGDVKTYQCDLCPKVCTQKSNLKCHMASVHCVGDVKTYQCDICSKVFNQKSKLKTHLNRVHWQFR